MRALAATVLVVAACAEPPLGATGQEVIGGQPTPAGRFPAVGALMYGARGAGCTGTLIAPDAVLTAAHCLAPSMINGVPLGFTLALDTRVDAAAIAARRVFVHEGFDVGVRPGPGLTRFDDVGVVLLAEPITDVAPVRLPRPDAIGDLTAGLVVVIVGYGRTRTDTLAVGVKYDAETELIEVGTSELRIASRGQPQSCEGDSGGPTLARVGRGPRVIGVVSRSFDATSRCLDGAVDTRVDAYLDWIHDKVPTGLPCGSGLAEACLDDEDHDGHDGWCSAGPRGGPGAGLLALVVATMLGRRRRTT